MLAVDMHKGCSKKAKRKPTRGVPSRLGNTASGFQTCRRLIFPDSLQLARARGPFCKIWLPNAWKCTPFVQGVGNEPKDLGIPFKETIGNGSSCLSNRQA